ncbi:MAG: beta-glucosidase [Flavobacteriales bacterium]|nr:MAG: beta-glucosidase [Flavobacteriales bacterium]
MSPQIKALELLLNDELKKSDFGNDFLWGVATAAYQIEGARNEDGKSDSVWDTFSHTKGKIKTGENADVTCDFYHRYESDLEILRQLNFDVFRFSLAWSRIIPTGIGKPNQKGIDFYHKVIDTCLEKGMQPWVTLYHWDLPQTLEDKGGWRNRDIINWFGEYVDVCTRAFGDKVKNWMVFNEPVAFTVLGYLLGIHAPGEKWFQNFFPAMHHTTMCHGVGGNIIRKNVKNAYIGSTFSCSSAHPARRNKKDEKVAAKLDALLNRLYIEPVLGMGYPVDGWKLLAKVEKYIKDGDEQQLKFDFDFIGIQNYTRIIAKYSPFIPFLWGNQIHPKKRDVQMTEMEWEVYPEGIYEQLKKFAAYDGVKKIIVTENGSAFPDKLEDNRVHDEKRVNFYKDYLKQVLRAKKEGVPVDGYLCWTMMDNFEWAEGYKPRFGLVYVDYETQRRIVKDSGYWWRDFLNQ